jgi:hypothetical protein
MIKARRAGEPDLAVLEDRLLLLAGETDILLFSLPGTYRLNAFTKTGKRGDATTSDVKQP